MQSNDWNNGFSRILNMKRKIVGFIGSLIALGATSFAQNAAAADAAASTPASVKVASPQVDRPPQFVMMAFDGSLAQSMWQATRAFSRDMTAQNKPLKFTYFISGVYYVEHSLKDYYVEPERGRGKSAIGWGKDGADLLSRYNETNLAFQEGNEIGSHANGHFDGGQKWTLEQWTSEFSQWQDIIFNFFTINKLAPTKEFANGWLFKKQDVVGFRAPLLAWNKNMQAVLKEYGFRYDTSQTALPNYWPQKTAAGFWNFPLADLVVAGTGKHTLSMDYNFYYTQSKGLPDPSHSSEYEEQMVQTYLNYFESNYAGNRAPVHIGHHFAQWNRGAYWRAMRRVANAVCGLPEVKCVTYHELADFMDARTPAELQAYRRGNFVHAKPIHLASLDARALDLDVKATSLAAGQWDLELKGADASAVMNDPRAEVELIVNGESTIDRSSALHHTVLVQPAPGESSTVQFRVVKDGKEVLSHTRVVSTDTKGRSTISEVALEHHAMMGDLPAAHISELVETAEIY